MHNNAGTLSRKANGFNMRVHKIGGILPEDCRAAALAL